MTFAMSGGAAGGGVRSGARSPAARKNASWFGVVRFIQRAVSEITSNACVAPGGTYTVAPAVAAIGSPPS